ncbi:MAG: M28 family peptidase [Cocleimonas sp.]
MLQTFVKKSTDLLIDWLIALLGVSLILWFGFTLPVFSFSKDRKVDAKLLEVSEQNLKKHAEVLAYFYAPRTIEYGTLNLTARYLHKELSKIGNTHYQPYWTLSGRYSNVILNLGPNTKEIIVIGAHYDAHNSSLDIDGNASGVAALVELANQLAKNQDKLSIGVQIVAYPLSQKDSVIVENMGSYQHAARLQQSVKQVKLMLSLDNVGSFSDDEHSQKYPYQFMHQVYPDKGNYISLVGRLQDYSEIIALKKSFKSASALPLYSFNLPASSYPTRSPDHLNYQRHGFPAVAITDTAAFREIEIDKKEVAERLDYKKIALLVQGLYQVVMDSKPAVQEPDGLAQQNTDFEPSLLEQKGKSGKTGGGVL